MAWSVNATEIMVLVSNKDARKQVEIVFGEPERSLRGAFRSALHRENYTNFTESEKYTAIRQHIERRQPDILIVDAKLSNENVPAMVRELRQGKIGINPFVPVILTLWEPTQDLVRACASSGADDLLVKPISPGQLIERMTVLVDNRKPFVVTSDYIGPDRRKDVGRENKIPLIEVPNTFRRKMRGEKIDQASLNAMIAEAQNEINDERLKRNAFQIAFLVGLILPPLKEGRSDAPDLASNLRRMVRVTKDTGVRMEGTDYAHVTELCTSMREVAERLSEGLENPGGKDIKLLKPLSDAIMVGFNPKSDAKLMASQITAAVSTYSAKQQQKK